MLQPMSEQLAKLHTQQLLREADAERLAREARGGAHHPMEGRIASLCAGLAALAAIARLGQHRTPPPAEPVPTDGSSAGLSVTTPAAS